ncbi:hypothetical protein Tco_0076916, partial [Tanacetum coccineum]
VVRISLESDEILRVHGERTQGVVKTLMNTKWKRGHMLVSTLWIKLYSEYEYEIRYHPGKVNVVTDALSRRVRAVVMTIQYGVSLVGSQMDEAHASRYLVHPGADKKYYNLGDMYWWP